MACRAQNRAVCSLNALASAPSLIAPGLLAGRRSAARRGVGGGRGDQRVVDGTATHPSIRPACSSASPHALDYRASGGRERAPRSQRDLRNLFGVKHHCARRFYGGPCTLNRPERNPCRSQRNACPHTFASCWPCSSQPPASPSPAALRSPTRCRRLAWGPVDRRRRARL